MRPGTTVLKKNTLSHLIKCFFLGFFFLFFLFYKYSSSWPHLIYICLYYQYAAEGQLHSFDHSRIYLHFKIPSKQLHRLDFILLKFITYDIVIKLF